MLAFQNTFLCWQISAPTSTRFSVQHKSAAVRILLPLSEYFQQQHLSQLGWKQSLETEWWKKKIKWGSSCVGKKQLKPHYWGECSVLKSPLSSPQWPWWSHHFCGKQHPFLTQNVSFFYRSYKSYPTVSKTGAKYFMSVWLPFGISCVIEWHFPSQPPSLRGPLSSWNTKKPVNTEPEIRQYTAKNFRYSFLYSI